MPPAMARQAACQQLERLIHPAVAGYALRCALRVWGRIPQELRTRGILDRNRCHIYTIKSALRISWDYVNRIIIDANDLHSAEEDVRATCHLLNELPILKLQIPNCIYLPPARVQQKAPLPQEVQAGLKALLAAVRAVSYAAQSPANYGDHGVASLALEAETWSIAAEPKVEGAIKNDLEHFATEWSITPANEKDDTPVLPKSDKPILLEGWPLYPHAIPGWFQDAMNNGWVFPN
jgi:hypothetical protein